MKNDSNLIIVRLFFSVPAVFIMTSGLLMGQNLITNPGFENGTTGWTKIGDCTLSTSTLSHSGNHSGFVADRIHNWNGINQSMLNVMKNRKTYRISGWVQLQNAASDDVGISVMQEDSRGIEFIHVHWTTGYDDRWVLLSGMFTLNVVGELSALNVYFEGPAAGVSFYLDDITIEEFNWRTEANARIEQIRKRDVQISVLSLQGEPVSNLEMQIKQIRHLFGFGSTIDYNVLINTDYANFFKDNFQWATPDSDLKWYINEPKQGQVDYTAANAIYEFCSAHDIKMRGHSIFWAGDAFIPEWAKHLSKTELRAAVENRMNSVVNEFKGKLAHWEVNNEMLYGSFYKDNLVEIDNVPVRVWMFQQAHSIDSNCVLFVNDYGPIAFGVQLEEYKNQITGLLQAGAPIHGIGVQCHVDSGYNRGLFLSRFESMAEPNLPIWVSEFDVEQSDENYRANDFEDLYRIAFSQPAVHGILLFGFWENAHWRPHGHIVNADWTLNEAGRRYEALMDEWTTKLVTTTDVNGNTTFRGFHGTYEVTLNPPGTQPTIRTIEILPGDGFSEFTLQLDATGQAFASEEPAGLPVALSLSEVPNESGQGGQIQGVKWEDLDGYGICDPNGPVVAGVTVYLDLNENGQLDENEPSSVTNEDGQYMFSDLVPGTYKVAELVPEGWRQSFPPEEGKLLFLDVSRDNQDGVDGLDSPCSATMSPDGSHIYVTATYGDALVVFSCNTASGQLNFVEVVEDGRNGVDGLDGVCSVAVSPDGNHVYTAGAYDDALTVFSRDPGTGQLTFVEVVKDNEDVVNGLDSVRSVAVSPDGNHVYAAGTYDDALAVLGRDRTTGRLDFIEVLQDGWNGVDGLYGAYSVAVSPDGGYVYTAGIHDDALTVFRRDRTTGQLTFVEVLRDDQNGVDGLHGVSSITISRDSNSLYTASIYDNAVTLFSRNQTTGQLTFVEMLQDGEDGVDGLGGAHSVKLSCDGTYLYAAGKYDDALTVLRCDQTTGQLSFVQMLQDGEGSMDGLDGVSSIAVSPDGNYVYAIGAYDDAVAVFSRSQGPYHVDISAGQVVEGLDFGNYEEPREFSGTTWEDLNGDGVWDSSEPILAGVTIYLDLSEDDQLDETEPYTVTNNQGKYSFSDLESGTYKVAQIIPTGQYLWWQTFPPQQRGELSFVERLKDGQDGMDGLCGAYSVTVSPDGTGVYAVGTCDSSLVVFSRDEGSGQLTFTQVLRDGENLVNGLDGTHSVSVSPDGKYVYAAGTYDNALAVFKYNETTRRLTFVEAIIDGQDGVDGLRGVMSLTVSPDGSHVYAAGTLESALSVFTRDQATGQLNFVEALKDDQDNVDGLGSVRFVTVSPDGNHVYAAGTLENAIPVFNRDKTTGQLTLVQVLQNDVNGVAGLGAVLSVTVSPDGKHVYAAGAGDDALAVFRREGGSGLLTFVDVYKDDEGQVDGLDGVSSVTLSQDGNYVYAAGTYENMLAVFSRDKITGRLSFLNGFSDTQGGEDRLASISSVAVSPKGGHVYAPTASNNAVAVLKQGPHYVDIIRGQAVQGINFGSQEEPREIRGATWEDLDADGFWDVGEPALAGVTIYLDLNENGQLDMDEPYVMTDEDGEFVFAKLDPNMYRVAVVAPYGTPGWAQSFPPETDELTFVEVASNGQNFVEGLRGACSVTVNPDGKHVYAVSNIDDALAVFSRETVTGRLSFVEVFRNGENNVDGLDGVCSVTVSPDGNHLYTVGSDNDALAVFRTDAATGWLTFVEVFRNGQNGVDGLYAPRSVTVSPEGDHVYATGTFDDALVVFRRDKTTGQLTFVESVKNGQNSVDRLIGPESVTVSPDGHHVYVGAAYSDSLVVFTRNSDTGQLTFVQAAEDDGNGVDGLDGVSSVKVSPDGNSVYAAGSTDDALAIFSRDQTTGYLTFVEVLRNGQGGIGGLDGAHSVAISPDSGYVYAAGTNNNALVVFSRDQGTGLLTFIQILNDNQGNVDGLDSVSSVVVSPNGQHVYTAAVSDNAVGVFKRGPYWLNVTVGQVLRGVNFGYYEPGEIRGTTWEDLDADGAMGVHEPVITDVNIYLDLNQNGQLDTVEPSAVTDDSGEYVFTGLRPGTYKVAQIAPCGWEQSSPPNNKLEFLEVLKDGHGAVDGLSGAFSVTVSPEGNHIYVAGTYDDALAVFSRNTATGLLTFVETIENGQGDINGLDGVHSVTLSPDGRHLYATGTNEDALVVFSRDPYAGHLTFVETLNNGQDGVDGLYGAFWVAVSPDGNHMYATGTYGDALAIFSRNSDTGRLTFVEALKDGHDGVDGLNSVRSVMVSPDGKHVYAAGTYDNALALFNRDADTGQLSFVEAIRDDQNGVDGLAATIFVTVSPQGRHVYAVGAQDSAIAVFSRDGVTGRLTFVQVIKDGQGDVYGLAGASSVAISPDGNYVYATGWAGDALAILSRDKTTGRLVFVEAVVDGQRGIIDGLDAVVSAAVSSDGRYVYTAAALDHAVAVFKIGGPQYIDVNLGQVVRQVDFGNHKLLSSDLNIDYRVNMVDFAMLASRWRHIQCQDTWWCDGTDLNRDGSVDLADLAFMTSEWLATGHIQDPACE